MPALPRSEPMELARRTNPVKRRVALVVVALAVLVAPTAASAHPLGNFTTNRYDEVVVSGDRIYVHAVVDLAEIPTFQAKPDVERLGRAVYVRTLVEEIHDGLSVSVSGESRPLRVLRRSLVFPDGAAGLRTTRLEAVFDAGPAPAQGTIELRDESFPGRVGWREIVVSASRGAAVATADVPAESVSDQLRTYPTNLLDSPLEMRVASASVRAGDAAGSPPAIGPAGSATQAATVRDNSPGSRFSSLIEERDLSLGFVLLALVLALFWGAAHALSPGHGKAIVAAYLMGTKGRPRDAFALGGIVTVTHTIGVFALGLATLALSEFIVPEDLYPWMNLVSALLVVAVGVTVLRQRFLVAAGRRDGAHHHRRAHGHHHHSGMTDEEHARAHLPEKGTGKRGLLAVGISGGLLPCPTALVVLLAAISLHRVAFGLVLILAFSVGLASVVSAIGLLAIGARGTFKRVSFEGRIVRALPAVSALLVFGIGIVMTARALPRVI